MRILIEIMKYITLMFTMVMSIYLGIVIIMGTLPNILLTVVQIILLVLIICSYDYMLEEI